MKRLNTNVTENKAWDVSKLPKAEVESEYCISDFFFCFWIFWKTPQLPFFKSQVLLIKRPCCCHLALLRDPSHWSSSRINNQKLPCVWFQNTSRTVANLCVPSPILASEASAWHRMVGHTFQDCQDSAFRPSFLWHHRGCLPYRRLSLAAKVFRGLRSSRTPHQGPRCRSTQHSWPATPCCTTTLPAWLPSLLLAVPIITPRRVRARRHRRWTRPRRHLPRR